MSEIKQWFKDTVTISDDRFCPAHRIPHKLPIGKKIECERCHIHKKKLNMAHHKLFCRYMKCQNYHFMIKKHKTNYDRNNESYLFNLVKDYVKPLEIKTNGLVIPMIFMFYRS